MKSIIIIAVAFIVFAVASCEKSENVKPAKVEGRRGDKTKTGSYDGE